MGALHETVWNLFVFAIRARIALLADRGGGMGMQRASDGGFDRGKAFDARSTAMGAEAAERESNRSEIEPVLRRSSAGRHGGCGHVGGRRAWREKEWTLALH